MRANHRRHAIVFSAAIVLAHVAMQFSPPAAAGICAGSASGYSVTYSDDPANPVASTNWNCGGTGTSAIYLDPMAAGAEATYGTVKSYARSQANNPGYESGTNIYAASYFSDILSFSGTTGNNPVSIAISGHGLLSDKDKTLELGWPSATYIEDFGTAGTAAARYRLYFGDDTLDPTDMDFALFDSEGAGGQDLMWGNTNACQSLVTPGPVTAGSVDCFVFLLTFTWDYEKPLPFGLLMETWSADGGLADFFNTGAITELTVVDGTKVKSESGTEYFVRTTPPTHGVPAPAPLGLLGLGLGALGLARRRLVEVDRARPPCASGPAPRETAS